MIIFLPTKIRQTGGSSTFAQKLRVGLVTAGHSVIFQWSDKYDLLLVNAQCPLRYIIHAKMNHRPIVQRLDGVYYPMTVTGKNYRLANLPMKIILKYFANRIIYQSDYSYRCAERFLSGKLSQTLSWAFLTRGERVNIRPVIIYNGVDTKLFSPWGEKIELRDNPEQQIFITASRFRRTDQILPLLAAFRFYCKKFQANAKLVVIGDFTKQLSSLTKRNIMDSPIKSANDRILSGIHLFGAVDNCQLPVYLRSADAFLFTSINPPCPNNVIEAMACGLPIVGVADGSMPEICVPGKNAELIPADSDGWWQPRQLDLELFAANMAKVIKQRQTYAKNSWEIAKSRFKLDRMAKKYLDVFSECTS